MSHGTCNFSCSVFPTELVPNPDITGIGITLAYTVTACLALGSVIAYYFIAYLPGVDPFGTPSEPLGAHINSHYVSNPVDEIFLHWRLKKRTNDALNNQSAAKRLEKDLRWQHISSASTQCMLIMSDFQLVTGFAVLLSGYTQLRCGISTYHWQRIVKLAWFSSITHLCCLTFLRDYFCQNKLAQFWRIPGMILLVVALCIAMVPDAQYYPFINPRKMRKIQESFYQVAFDHTICFYGHHPTEFRDWYFQDNADELETKKQRTIISASILVFGMLNRLWRLYAAPVNTYFSMRKWSSHQRRRQLRIVSKWTKSHGLICFWTSGFIYRPMLALFLLLRVFVDMATSKAFEVYWLMVGLCWGLFEVFPLDPILQFEDLEWTFGQVIALLLLAAPVIALIEGYVSNIHQAIPSNNLSNSEITRPEITSTPVLDLVASKYQKHSSIMPKDDPDFDYYNNSKSFATLMHALFLAILALSVASLMQRRAAPVALIMGFNGATTPLLLANFYMCTLFSLSIEQHMPSPKARRRVVRTICFFSYCAAFAAAITVAPFWLVVPAGVYLGLLLLELCLARRSPTVSLSLPHTSSSISMPTSVSILP